MLKVCKFNILAFETGWPMH